MLSAWPVNCLAVWVIPGSSRRPSLSVLPPRARRKIEGSWWLQLGCMTSATRPWWQNEARLADAGIVPLADLRPVSVIVLMLETQRVDGGCYSVELVEGTMPTSLVSAVVVDCQPSSAGSSSLADRDR